MFSSLRSALQYILRGALHYTKTFRERGIVSAQGLGRVSLKFNIHSDRWRKLRKHILKRDKRTCQYFKRFGERIDATRVHHIYPVKDYPEYAWCEWNLISLSAKAHELMHIRKTGELSEIGKALQNRTTPPRVG